MPFPSESVEIRSALPPATVAERLTSALERETAESGGGIRIVGSVAVQRILLRQVGVRGRGVIPFIGRIHTGDHGCLISGEFRIPASVIVASVLWLIGYAIGMGPYWVRLVHAGRGFGFALGKGVAMLVLLVPVYYPWLAWQGSDGERDAIRTMLQEAADAAPSRILFHR